MLPPYQNQLVLTYVANVHRCLGHRHPRAEEFAEWMRDNAYELGLDFQAVEFGTEIRGLERTRRRRRGDAPRPEDDTEAWADDWRLLARIIDDARKAQGSPGPDPVGRRLRQLGERTGLGALDMAILEALLLYETVPVVESLFDENFREGRSRYRRALNLRSGNLPGALGEAHAAIRNRFAPDAPLTRTGLASLDEDQDVSMVPLLRRLTGVVPDTADVRQVLIGQTRQSELEWSDFDHLGQGRDDVAGLIRGALERNAKGVNVLVYGPPGTGKTEFCHVLARQIGAELFSVGETDGGGGEPSRAERIGELRLTQSLLGADRNALLLFDEMDDVLGGFAGFAGMFDIGGRRPRGGVSKVFMNRMLEEAPAPTLWTTNRPYLIDAALRRRMVFALEMRQPPPRIRTRIWSRQLASQGIEASEEQARQLAYEFDATPGVAAGATTAGDLSDGGFPMVRRAVRGLSRALGCDKPQRQPAACFDPAFAAADLDLGALADRLAANGDRHFSLCLQGPPGTGKSAYACYLAERLGLETLHKRASDLLGMYVGETEKNIADAFAQARDENAFLVFDEADSLLADRRGAHRSWEVSQVNEMLTWMESHPLPFACTTNYVEKLDEATLRRFVFKVTLGNMTAEMVRNAFPAWFGCEAPAAALRLANLTPGDFEVVRRKARLLGQQQDADALCAMLKAECDAKPGVAGTLGFGA